MSEQIKALCIDPKVPDHVKHHFSADCAERAMFAWSEQTGKEPFPEWWELMEAIRDYAEGRIALKALKEIGEAYFAADWTADSGAYWAAYWAADKEAHSAADWEADWAAYWASSRSAYSATSWAASRAADNAADWAAYSAADSAAEREWQLQHFHALIAQHDAQRLRLLGLFKRRAEEIEQALPQIQQQYEEALFV